MTQGKLTLRLAYCTAVAVLGNSFLYGYNIGVLNTPALIIREFMNETYTDRGAPLTETSSEVLWAVTNAVFVLAGMVGSFSSAKIGDVIGRRRGMMVASVVMYVAAICAGVTKIAKAPEMLIISRVLVGLHSGCVINLASIYLAEISPRHIRGAIGTCHQLAITIGICVSQIFGLTHLMGTYDLWPILVSIHGLFCFISTVGFFFCPESPRYLLIKKGEEEESRKVLQDLWGGVDVSDDINEMKAEATQQQSQQVFSLKMLLTDPTLRMPLIIAVVLQIAQQWSGINAVFFYSKYIFIGAGIDEDKIQYAIVGTGLINVAATIICVPLMERIGRRPLLIYPMISMVISMVLLTISIRLQDVVSGMAYLSIFCMHTYVVGFAVGLGPIPFLVVNEIFRQAPRATAMSLALVFQWMANFILVATFRFLQNALGAYTFLIFVCTLSASVVFIFFYVPETKNRTFDEIAHNLSHGLRAGGVRPASKEASKEEVELMETHREEDQVA